MAFAAEQRFHKTVLFRERLGLLDVVADAGKTLEIFADIGAGFLALDAALVGKSKGGNAVDDAEIGDIPPAAPAGARVLPRHAEHSRRRRGVDIRVVAERVEELLDAGDSGEDPQQYLGIIG